MKRERIEIRLSDMIHVLYKHIGLIAVTTVIGLFVGMILSALPQIRGEMPKRYRITATAAVTSRTENGQYSMNTEEPSAVDFQLAAYMVDSAIFLMEDENTQRAALAGREDHLLRALRANLELEQYLSTQLITITLYWQNPNEGVEILNNLVAAASDALLDVFQIGSIRMTGEPLVRRAAFGGWKISAWANFALLGFLMGAALCILRQMLHPVVIHAEDVLAQLDLEVFAEVTSKGDASHSYGAAAHVLRNRIVRGTCIAIVSATPKEGKTTAAGKLSEQLAELGEKVLLVPDNTENDRPEGPQAVKGLDVLSMPWEALQGIKEKYDYVLLDTPSLSSSLDVLGLNQMVQSALLIVRCDHAQVCRIRDAVNLMEKCGIPVIGCIVTEAARR